MQKIVLLLLTLANLRPAQLFFFVVRRLLSYRRVTLQYDPVVCERIALQAPIGVAGRCSEEGYFEFLNQRADYSQGIDWAAEGLPRLWGYNLHYFDYLRDPGLAVEHRAALVQDWIDNNAMNSQPGWEPFTVSLRVVNWIFFLLENPARQNSSVLQSLYLQALWLEKNDERHILANHYFENLKALAFAGAFFTGVDADRWRARALREIPEQLAEQTLSDGGHYERSPQYHCIMLENYLDLYNLANNNSALYDADYCNRLLDTARAGLSFIDSILFPDQRIPLFNDAAFEASPSAVELADYAERLFAYKRPSLSDALIDLPDSGFYGQRLGQDMLIMDCGDIGPDYQPGHTHCDFLSYELMKAGQRIIVDTGVSEYQPGEQRRQLRSTAAHNTISVNGLEQSEVWGEFRVARRARKLEGAIAQSDLGCEFAAAYAGFFKPERLFAGPQFCHSRRVLLQPEASNLASIGAITVQDEVRSIRGAVAGQFKIESFIHFHPDISILEHNVADVEAAASAAARSRLIFGLSGRAIGEMDYSAALGCAIEPGVYCPEFGRRENNIVLRLTLEASLPASLEYRISFY